jgi:hypothetical protein
MPSFPFVQQGGVARANPLSAQRLNQAHSNIEAVDRVALVEHFATGKHNALEVPWVLGFVADGASPGGFLFDTEYGGGTLTRPSTGLYTVSVAAGVVTTSALGYLEAAVMASVADSAIESKPHIITPELVSETSIQFRVRALSSALGAGNTWADANRNICVGLHALKKAPSTSLLGARLEKQRRNFLTDQATDWNALVQNQGIARKASLVEHTSTGRHNANRIAKASGWFRPSAGPSYDITAKNGVASVSRISLGVVQVTMDDNFTNPATMACFPEGQPASKDELIIINGRGFNTGAGTSTFRFYIYAYSGGNWSRVDRSFFAPMFGAIA